MSFHSVSKMRRNGGWTAGCEGFCGAGAAAAEAAAPRVVRVEPRKRRRVFVTRLFSSGETFFCMRMRFNAVSGQERLYISDCGAVKDGQVTFALTSCLHCRRILGKSYCWKSRRGWWRGQMNVTCSCRLAETRLDPIATGILKYVA